MTSLLKLDENSTTKTKNLNNAIKPFSTKSNKMETTLSNNVQQISIAITLTVLNVYLPMTDLTFKPRSVILAMEL